MRTSAFRRKCLPDPWLTLSRRLSYDLRMANEPTRPFTRADLITALNDDLSREYQAIIAYVVYSQSLKGAQYMSIAKELEVHAGEELQHALTIAKQIDYLGGYPTAVPKPVATPEDAPG